MSAPVLENGTRLILPEQVDAMHPVSRVTRWRMIRNGEFPKPIRISRGRIAWLERDLLAWVEKRKAMR